MNDTAATVRGLRRLEIASALEASTLLLLLGVAVPLKHIAGWALGVRIIGPVHGLAFVAFCYLAIEAVSGGGWTRKDGARLVIGAFVPFGGFLNLPLLSRKIAALR